MNERIILLIEDNPDDIKLTQRAFNKSNFGEKIILEVVSSGDEALNFLFRERAYKNRDKQEMPSIILLDLNLPIVDGFQILERIRADKRTKLIPVA